MLRSGFFSGKSSRLEAEKHNFVATTASEGQTHERNNGMYMVHGTEEKVEKTRKSKEETLIF